MPSTSSISAVQSHRRIRASAPLGSSRAIGQASEFNIDARPPELVSSTFYVLYIQPLTALLRELAATSGFNSTTTSFHSWTSFAPCLMSRFGPQLIFEVTFPGTAKTSLPARPPASP